MSRMVTCHPACAETWAMPEPIRPEPMTASRPAMCVSPSSLKSFVHPSESP
jgi:hypothetical protein